MEQIEIHKLEEQLIGILDYAEKLEKRFASELDTVHPALKKSAVNLLHYVALRHTGIKELQDSLGKLGVSRLAKTESNVAYSINSILKILNLLSGKTSKLKDEILQYKEGNDILNNNLCALLGGNNFNRRVRIMVTLPGECAKDYEFIKNLLANGMNCARINCSHDNEYIWLTLINNIRKASLETGFECKIAMDLGGPKLRTGLMKEGPRVLHISPQKDEVGKVVEPFYIRLIPENEIPDNILDSYIPMDEKFLKRIIKGDKLTVIDTRGKEISFKVTGRDKKEVNVKCNETAYVIAGSKISYFNERKKKKISSVLGNIPPYEKSLILNIGDTLILHKDEKPGEPAQIDDEGIVTSPAHISCTLPEVFADVRIDEPILLDDGKIEGTITSVSKEEITVRITYAKAGGTKLKGDKGINLPKSNLNVSGLTEKDKHDLKFVVEHADIVSMSFVNTEKDIEKLQQELSNLNASAKPLIIKIETQKSFENLPGILLTAMRSYPIGVMIARGDLAVECGWKHLAEIQEEILMLCEAAHIPNIWATQVLESLAKKGRPSRAEITDAAMGQRAECVMLNKGPHIMDALNMLNDILEQMQLYSNKKAPILPTLKVPHTFNITDMN